jgi:hypothetical protein
MRATAQYISEIGLRIPNIIVIIYPRPMTKLVPKTTTIWKMGMVRVRI